MRLKDSNSALNFFEIGEMSIQANLIRMKKKQIETYFPLLKFYLFFMGILQGINQYTLTSKTNVNKATHPHEPSNQTENKIQ